MSLLIESMRREFHRTAAEPPDRADGLSVGSSSVEGVLVKRAADEIRQEAKPT